MEKTKLNNCGPGCDCGKPSGNKKAKAVICLIVLMAICGIFVYKAKSAKQSAPAITETAFAAPIVNQATGQEPAVKSVGDQKKVGEFIDSLASLNKVAINQDAVFVFIPANENGTISKETINAIAAAEQKLKSSNIRIGLYTLRFSPSKEYASIAAQLTLPGMLVISRGRGMGAVSGEITETKLLQAYVASSRAGGCCPSGGSGSSVCK
ncbi:MAG: hypothetical protein MUO27_07170 [Sedimentisphaerales bacterium]|nr:hypothetical protein [Sedimentisphaerales bacterium]